LAATLQEAVLAAKQLFEADAAGIMLADMEGRLRWASASDERAQTLEDNQELFAAGPCAEAFSTGKPAVMHDATSERRWGEIALTFVEVHIRSGLSVPVENANAWTSRRPSPTCAGRPAPQDGSCLR
jgi:GAF domain-containing protein